MKITPRVETDEAASGNRRLGGARQLDVLGVRVFCKPFDLGAFLGVVAEAATRLPSALPPHPTHQ